jgi:hypothetical protein
VINGCEKQKRLRRERTSYDVIISGLPLGHKSPGGGYILIYHNRKSIIKKIIIMHGKIKNYKI